MRFFKHHEFPASRLTLANAQAEWKASYLPNERRFFMTLRGSGPTISGATIEFDIVRRDSFVENAPFPITLRAENFTGTAYADPPGDTNEYDPSQHKITLVWDVDDDPYTFVTDINIPNVWRDRNRHYGNEITHVFPTGGKAYTFTAFAFDEDGRWGTATYTTPTVATRAARFTDATTIYYSREGNFSEVPGTVSSANKLTTWADVLTRAGQIDNTGERAKILFRRGEVYDNHPKITIQSTWDQGIHMAAWGSAAARPLITPDPSEDSMLRWSSGPESIMEDLEFRGGWDSTTETGNVQPVSTQNAIYCRMLVHRCKFSGFDYWTVGANYSHLHDTEITNGKIFTLTHSSVTGNFASFVGCRLTHHPDALSGGGNTASNPDNWQFGNMHHVRFFGGAKMYISLTYTFSRVGWSIAFPRDHVSQPPSTPQAAWRISSGANTVRWRIYFDRVAFEGPILTQFVGTPNPRVNPNIVFDKIVVATWQQHGSFYYGEYNGVTIRNAIMFRDNYQPMPSKTNFGRGAAGFAGADSTPNYGPVRLYNNTVVVLGDEASLGPNALLDGMTNAASTVPVEVGSNVIYAPDIAVPRGTGVGGDPDFVPFTEIDLTGFVRSFKGLRWNYPPIGWQQNDPYWSISCGQARFNETGTNEDVPINGWVKLPWPDFTGLCNGAGMSDVRAAAAGNSTQWHTCSVGLGDTFGKPNGTNRMHDDSLVTTSQPGVRYDLTDPTGLRIQNVSSVAWPAGEMILVLLDLSDNQMDFVPGSGPPSTDPISILVPDVGTDGVIASRPTSLWAYDYWDMTIRKGSIDPDTGTAVSSGVHRLGAATI